MPKRSHPTQGGSPALIEENATVGGSGKEHTAVSHAKIMVRVEQLKMSTRHQS